MKVWRAVGGVAGGAYVAQDVTAADVGSFGEAGGIAVQVRVVVAVSFIVIELINSETARFAVEEFLNGAFIRGQDGSAARGQNVSCFVVMAYTAFLESVVNVCGLGAFYGDDEVQLRLRGGE